MLGQIQNSLSELKREMRKKYSPLIFEVECRKNPQSQHLVLEGKVLTPKQLKKVLALFPANSPLSNRIQVLGEGPSQKLGRVTSVVDLFGSPERKSLMSQILPQEGPFHLLDYRTIRGHHLVRLPDKTLGWAEKTHIQESPEFPRPLWEYLMTQQLRYLPPSQQEELILTARTFIGVPYRLGGRTRGGIDCSALVQALLRDSLGLMIPRHSGDQRKLGFRVSPRDVRKGDLLFGCHKRKKILHVALVMEDRKVLHSCLQRGEVTEEPLQNFEEMYQIAAGRRIFDGP